MAEAAKNRRKERPSMLKRLMGGFSAFKRTKSGHFVVVASEGDEQEKFVICLEFLNDPRFLKLLKQAEEEFGFEQEGALALPCRPEELQRILQSGKAVHGT
ncbi:hypothetical protein Droror1_Dr00026212 [Drosera rotundifolia]